MKIDISFGGVFYAIVDSKDLSLRVIKENILEIQDIGMQVKHYVEATIAVQYPLQTDLQDIYRVIFSDKPNDKNADLRNVTIFCRSTNQSLPMWNGKKHTSSSVIQTQSSRC